MGFKEKFLEKKSWNLKHVTSELAEGTEICTWLDEVFRRMAYLRLPPVYPRLLELTDTGRGVSASSAESRMRILERARIHGNEKIIV